jgi:hypothetical protein
LAVANKRWQHNGLTGLILGFFLFCQVLVYCSGGDSALAHCEDYGGGITF